MKRSVICPGSFDPITMGHLDIILRASKMYDHVIVAVIVNLEKTYTFNTQERVELVKKATASVENIEVVSFDTLLAHYANERNVTAIVKGLRAMSDFEYEFQMALINKKLNVNLETVFLPTNYEYMYLSSSVVKQVASLGGDIKDFVPECIHDEIVHKLYSKE